MAHDLFQDTMVYVGETPWHGLGRKIKATATAAEFLSAGNLAWKVNLEPAQGAKQDRKGRWNRLTIMRAKVGDEAGPVALGIVSARYHILQNTDAFAFFDPLIQSKWASYEAAGALGDGETVWVQVRLRDDMQVQSGEQVERYLLLRNRHNGEGSVSIRFTPVRVVCQNTLSFAEKHSPALASIRHSRLMHERLNEVAVDTIRNEIEAFSARAQRVFAAMAAHQLKPKVRLKLLKELCGERPKVSPPGGAPTRRELVEQRLEDQKTADKLAGTDTLWALYNAMTWVEDQRAKERAKKQGAEAGLNAKWFGSGADFKAKAFDTLSALVAAN